MKNRLIGGVLVCATLWASPALAQEDDITEYVPETEIQQMKDEKRQGWDGTLQASANVNLVSNSNVVGQADGFSMLFGLGLLSGLDYIHQRHEIRNTLKIAESFSKTPVLPEFIKSDDVVDFESLYNYFILSWFGAFGRFNAESQLFVTEEVRADPTTFAVSRRNEDGTTTVDLIEDTERLRLSDSFKPLTLNESVGVFAEPVQTTPFNLSTRLGFGLRQTWAQDVLAVQDDDTTETQIEVTDLTNPESSLTIFQGGLEGFVGIGGVLQDKRVTYDVGGTVLIPFINNDPQDRTATQLTRIGLVAGVAFAAFDWMSINYKLRLLRDPQLLDDLQVQNNLLLTFNYTFVERTQPEAPPEPSEAEKALEEEKERAAEAEQRAKEAEERAAELQEQLEAERAEPEPEPQPEPEPTPEPEPEPEPEPTPEQ
jgi:hypothetical protein